MHSPSQIVYLLAGSPPVPKGVAEPMDGPCLVCGFPFPTGVHQKDAIPPSDTDRLFYAAPFSTMVCSGCAWASSGSPPNTFRMWSVVYAEGATFPEHHEAVVKVIGEGRAPTLALLKDERQVCLTNKGLTDPVTSLLLNPPDTPWFVSIATSGQIHTLRAAKTNVGRSWVVRLERQDVFGDSDTFADVLYHSGRLKQLGFGDADILSGEPNINSLFRNPSGWQKHISHLSHYLNSGILELALWCHTKASTDNNVESARRFIDARNAAK